MTFGLYVLYGLGIALWQNRILTGLWFALRNRVVIRRDLRRRTADVPSTARRPLDRHLRMLITGAEAERLFPVPEFFYLCSVLCAVGVGVPVSWFAGPGIGLCSGLFAGVTPYSVLLARLHTRRVTRSREGDVLVQEILNNYKICDYNMKEAIEITAATLEEAPGAKRLLLQLAKGLQRAVTREEVEQLLQEFRYAIDTAWGNVLATNIFFAHLYGIRVDAAMEDLQASIVKSRQMVEHGKRENNEARLMLRYLAPVSFLLTVLAACRYFRFTLPKFFAYQFGTPLGLRWFLIMVMLYGVGLLIYVYFSREKMDL